MAAPIVKLSSHLPEHAMHSHTRQLGFATCVGHHCDALVVQANKILGPVLGRT